jgi:hypothetical protein
MDFSNAPTQQFGDGGIIPKGTLAWAILTLQPHNADHGIAEKPSQSSDAKYLEVELTIEGGPYDKRKIWDKIGVAGAEKYVQAGHAALRHILEVGKQASPQNPSGYVIDNYFAIDGLKVAIKITVEKGTGGHDDKNRCRYLSPNTESDTHKDFQKLLAGDTAPPAETAPAAPAATPAWGGGSGQTPATPAAATPAAATGTPPAKPAWAQ